MLNGAAKPRKFSASSSLKQRRLKEPASNQCLKPSQFFEMAPAGRLYSMTPQSQENFGAVRL
jgi:hypothetical protein